MTTKHTPGPWEVWPEVHGSHPEHLVYISVGPADKRRVCSTGVYGHKQGSANGKKPVVTEDECRANARLIAAAPDMLALLKQIDHGGYGFREFDAVKVLIAKAEGTT